MKNIHIKFNYINKYNQLCNKVIIIKYMYIIIKYRFQVQFFQIKYDDFHQEFLKFYIKLTCLKFKYYNIIILSKCHQNK